MGAEVEAKMEAGVEAEVETEVEAVEMQGWSATGRAACVGDQEREWKELEEFGCLPGPSAATCQAVATRW